MKAKNESKHYIDNKAFFQALINYKVLVEEAKSTETERPQVTDYIGDCFIKIWNISPRENELVNYSEFRKD